MKIQKVLTVVVVAMVSMVEVEAHLAVLVVSRVF